MHAQSCAGHDGGTDTTMKNGLGGAASVVALSFGLAWPAQADWIRDMTSEHCSEQSRSRISRSVRNQIESSVRRSEAAIAPPAPVGDLGCLDGLMGLSIDTFAPVGGLGSLFSGTLDGLVQGGSDPTRQICNFAQRKWKEATRPLAELALGAEAVLPGFADNFEQVNIPETVRSALETVPPEASPQTGTAESTLGPAAGSKSDLVDEIWDRLYGSGGSQ